ncbi:MAG: hypothetical protein EBT45_05175 [Alphaproteobacteria bacterium]|nr:hypothetical protein [Alphaproteobacteria bacterium]
MADKGYVFKEVSELSIEYWTNLCYVLGNKKGEVFNPETQPRMSTKLPGGHRFEAMIGKAVDSGLSVSIRMNRNMPLSLEDFGLPSSIQNELIKAVREGESILVSGGTSSGKTTFLKALIQYIPLEKRVLTVEDTPELEVPHLNKVHYLVNRNEKSPVISWPQVIDHLMRSRPDVIIAGELSIANTFALISLLDTGHTGFMTTVHSNSAKLAIEETIPTKVRLAEIHIPSLSDYLKKTLDWVIQIQKIPHVLPEGTVFKRSVTEIWQPQKNKFQTFYPLKLDPLKQVSLRQTS